VKRQYARPRPEPLPGERDSKDRRSKLPARAPFRQPTDDEFSLSWGRGRAETANVKTILLCTSNNNRILPTGCHVPQVLFRIRGVRFVSVKQTGKQARTRSKLARTAALRHASARHSTRRAMPDHFFRPSRPCKTFRIRTQHIERADHQCAPNCQPVTRRETPSTRRRTTVTSTDGNSRTPGKPPAGQRAASTARCR